MFNGKRMCVTNPSCVVKHKTSAYCRSLGVGHKHTKLFAHRLKGQSVGESDTWDSTVAADQSGESVGSAIHCIQTHAMLLQYIYIYYISRQVFFGSWITTYRATGRHHVVYCNTRTLGIKLSPSFSTDKCTLHTKWKIVY